MHQVAQTQLEEQAEQHDLEDNIGRHLQKVERGPRPLVEGWPTAAAVKSQVAEICGCDQISGLARLAMRAVHPCTSQ